MELAQLSTSNRVAAGKGAARKLRAQGQVPCNVYGNGKDSICVALNPSELEAIFRNDARRKNAVFQINLEDGSSRPVILKELQVHPVSRQFVHVDLYNVDFEKPVVRAIPLVMTGRAEGVKMGGKLTQLVRTIKVQCLPNDIPAVIEADVTKLDRKETMRVEEAVFPEGVKAVYKDNYGIAAVS